MLPSVLVYETENCWVTLNHTYARRTIAIENITIAKIMSIDQN